jgi:hypothetical protein
MSKINKHLYVSISVFSGTDLMILIRAQISLDSLRIEFEKFT